MHQLVKHQFVATDMESCWKFFSRPENLNEITPPDMQFKILTEVPEKVYTGLMIAYKVSPFPGWTTNWITEITHVEDGRMFIDEQRYGPYQLWHHEHHFKEVEGGIQMTDIVSYLAPFGFLGRWMEPFIIRPKIESIFSFREQKIEEIFGT